MVEKTLWNVHLRVPTKLLTPLLELIEAEGIIVCLGEQRAEPDEPVRRAVRIARRKDRRVEDVLFKHIVTECGGVITREAAAIYVATQNYKATGASSAISRLCNAGWLVRSADNKSVMATEIGVAKLKKGESFSRYFA